MPQLSVIVTASNRGKLLQRALRSLYSQLFRDWEMILILDHPVDLDVLDVEKQCKKLKNANTRRLPTIESSDIKHVAAAVNMALDLAKGEWVTYLCDDDVYMPNRFEPYFEAKRSVDAVVGNANFIQMDGTIVHQNTFSYQYPMPYLEGHAGLLEAIQPNNFICHDSIVHRNTDLRWPTDIQSTPNDWRFWLSLFNSGFRFKRIAAICEHAIMPTSWSNGVTQEDILAISGEQIQKEPGMKRVRYAKNVTKKKQIVTNTKNNKTILVLPGEQVNEEFVTYTDRNGVSNLYPGFSLCGEFSFPEIFVDESISNSMPVVTQEKNVFPEFEEKPVVKELLHEKEMEVDKENSIELEKHEERVDEKTEPDENPPAQKTSKKASFKRASRKKTPSSEREFDEPQAEIIPREPIDEEKLTRPRRYRNIAKLQDGTVLTSEKREPKHLFDLD